MLITEGFGSEQLLITEGFGSTISFMADRPLGDRIIQAMRIGTPKIVGNHLSDRGTKMQEAA